MQRSKSHPLPAAAIYNILYEEILDWSKYLFMVKEKEIIERIKICTIDRMTCGNRRVCDKIRRIR